MTGGREVTTVPGPAHSMNGRHVEGLDLGTIFALGIASEQKTDADAWHDDPEPVHASGLGGCPRAYVLRRDGHATDGLTMEAAFTFELGHWWHAKLEKYARLYEKAEPRFKVIATEEGGRHSLIPLVARCDLLFSWEGRPILADLKTEKPFAKQKRVNKAIEKGFPAPYSWEHKIQLAAQALVMEDLGYVPHNSIIEGRVLYLDKSSLLVDQVPCEITDYDRRTVMVLADHFVKAWEKYATTRELPPLLSGPDETWRCRARSTTDARGAFCAARSTCMRLAHDTEKE